MLADAMATQVVGATARIRRAWLAAIAHLRAVNTRPELELRLPTRDADALDGLHVAATHLAAQQHAAYVAAGQAAARFLEAHHTGVVPVAKRLPTAFDATDPPAVAWAQANALDKIRQITDDQRNMVRAILVRAARSGVNPRDVAREIAASIGLTDTQVAEVDSYRASLEASQYRDALARQLSSGQSDRAIAAAARADRSLTAEQIDLAVERYRANAVIARATTIARAEGLRVAHQGSRELYRQAIARGDVEAVQIQRSWVHRSGVKGKEDRPFHKTMQVGVVGFDEPFISGLGNPLMHPGDPDAEAEEVINCTCVEAVRILPPARRAA